MLLPKNGGGRTVAKEIMINNHAIGNLIREQKLHQVYSQMQLNQASTGMMTQTQDLEKLVKSNTVKKEDALRISTQPDELKTRIGII